MSDMSYPVNEYGVALSSYELGYSEPTDPERQTNINHLQWIERIYRVVGKGALFICFRDLKCLQEPMYMDEHQSLHDTFSQPKMPTPAQAYEEIERAQLNGECFSRRMSRKKREQMGYVAIGGYAQIPITDERLLACKKDCDFIINSRWN